MNKVDFTTPGIASYTTPGIIRDTTPGITKYTDNIIRAFNVKKNFNINYTRETMGNFEETAVVRFLHHGEFGKKAVAAM